jgi:signal transduction histidine kinase
VNDRAAAAAADALASLVAFLPAPALLLDPAGVVRASNAPARALLLPRDPPGGGGPAATADPARAAPEGAQPALEGRSIREFLVLAAEPGALRPGEYEARPPGMAPFERVPWRRLALALAALEPAERGFLALLRDQTLDERGLQIRITREKLDAISQLASGVAHEFNNMMASLYGFAQLARQDPRFHADLVGAVEEYAARTREITTRLRSLSPGRIEPLGEVDLAEIAEAVIARAAPALEQAGIAVVRRFAPDVPATLGARGELTEVFEALIENARHAIVKGGTITVEVRREEDALFASVSDTGTGIPRQNLARIFEPFFAMKATAAGTMRGGLGLAVALSHVRRHGGDMWAESEIGRGTTVALRIPIRAERRRSQEEVPVERRLPLAAATPRRILAVDDEEGMLRLLDSLLGGHAVTPARAARDAIAALEHAPFDYVILDIILEGEQDGFHVFDEIRRRDPGAKIILLTGCREDERLRDYVARAYGYLRKPFGVKDIQSLIV